MLHDSWLTWRSHRGSFTTLTDHVGPALVWGYLLALASSVAVLAQEETVSSDGQSPEMCTQNLLPNPSFGEGMTGWHVAKGSPEFAVIDTQEFRTGEASLCLKAPPAAQPVFLYSATLPVAPWQRYRLHFFHKNDGHPTGPILRAYPGESGHQTMGRAYWLGCDGAAEWTGYYHDFVFPTDVTELYITLCGGHWDEAAGRRGTYWIDDIEFGPANDLEPAGATGCSDESVIFNGGFELGYGDQPFGWSGFPGGLMLPSGPHGIAHYEGADTSVVWDDEDVYRGKRSLRIEYTGEDPRHQLCMRQMLYPEQGQEYDIRFFAKSEGRDARLAFDPYGEDNKWLFTACGTSIHSADWREYRLKYTPEDRTPVPCGLRACICLRGPGAVWIDELEMVRADVGLGPAAEPRPARPEARPAEVSDVAEEHCRRGKELKDQRKYAQAAEELRAAIEADPNHLEAHWVLGWVLVELTDTEGAVQAFRKVIELAPESDRANEARKALARLER